MKKIANLKKIRYYCIMKTEIEKNMNIKNKTFQLNNYQP